MQQKLSLLYFEKNSTSMTAIAVNRLPVLSICYLFRVDLRSKIYPCFFQNQECIADKEKVPIIEKTFNFAHPE